MECWTEKDDYTAGHAGVGCPGPETTDVGFTWIDSPFGIHIGDYKDTKLDVAKTLQVEGKGYIKDLEHGLPITRRAVGSDHPLEAVDEAPVLLRSGVQAESDSLPATANTLRVTGLGLAAGPEADTGGAAFYEITVSGTGWGENADVAPADSTDAEPVIYTARYLVTPWRHRSGRAGVSVETLAQSPNIYLVRSTRGDDGHSLMVELAAVSGERELVVDVKRVGRRCLAPAVSLREA